MAFKPPIWPVAHMLKRAQRLARERDRAESQPSKPRPASQADFSLRQSPLTRTLAGGVGRGQAASSLQKIAAAAVSESGVAHVNKSSLSDVRFVFGSQTFCWGSVVSNSGVCVLLLGDPWSWKARLGRQPWVRMGREHPTSSMPSTEQRIDPVEMCFASAYVVLISGIISLLAQYALVCASKAPVKPSISWISLLVRDAGVVRKNKINRKATAKRRRMLRLAMGRPVSKLLKASKRAALPAHHYRSWPVLRPHNLIAAMLDAGLEHELFLV